MLSFIDTSFVVKKNKEFVVYIPWDIPLSIYYKFEYQVINFIILVSSSHDLSFYFEDNPAKPPYKIAEIYDSRQKYTYPFKFTYWVTNDIFWEHNLLE